MGIEEKVEQLANKYEALEKKYDALIQQFRQRQTEKVLNVKQVAEILKLTTGGVNFHIRKGKIKAIGGRCKKITEAELLRFMQENNY